MMTTSYKKSIKNLNEAVKKFKATEKADCHSFGSYDEKCKNIADSNWEVLYAAREMMRHALIHCNVYEGCTDEDCDSIMKKLDNLFV